MNLTLFDIPPSLPLAASAADPHTSKLSAAEIDASGQRKHQCALVARLVKENPGKTSMELCRISGMDRHMIAKRLPDAEKLGLVARGPARTCTYSGRQALTWTGVTNAT